MTINTSAGGGEGEEGRKAGARRAREVRDADISFCGRREAQVSAAVGTGPMGGVSFGALLRELPENMGCAYVRVGEEADSGKPREHGHAWSSGAIINGVL